MSGPFSKYGIPLDPVTGRTVTIQPKLGYRFRVRFLQFGGLESATYSFDSMQQVVSDESVTWSPELPNINQGINIA